MNKKQSAQTVRKLQGIVLEIEKTGEKRKDEEGITWEKCIFEIKLTGFSKRTPDERLPENLKGRKVKLIRWCAFDWHYKLGSKKTLEPSETEAVLKEKPTMTVFW